MGRRIYWLVILCFTSACTRVAKQDTSKFQYGNNTNDSAIQLIQSGDIILRSGKDQISQLFKNINTRNKTYSHCGIALRGDLGIRVCHIIGTTQNGNGHLIYEPIDTFIQPKESSAWAIIRYDLDRITRRRLIQQVNSFEKEHVSFDTRFDLLTDDEMYCSEMVYKALMIATNNRNIVQTTTALSGKKYVAIDNLFGHKHCKTICEIAYK